MTIKAGDRIFADTNVLLSATDEGRDSHRDALQLISDSPQCGVHLVACGQIFREYLVVATRPMSQNGLGLPSRDALANIDQLQRNITLVDESTNVATRLRRLVEQCQLAGKRIHDANIVAVMLSNGIQVLVTDNPTDFEAFDAIEVVTSADAIRAIHQ